MNRFTARTEATSAVVAAERQAIWDALVDPGLVARHDAVRDARIDAERRPAGSGR